MVARGRGEEEVFIQTGRRVGVCYGMMWLVVAVIAMNVDMGWILDGLQQSNQLLFSTATVTPNLVLVEGSGLGHMSRGLRVPWYDEAGAHAITTMANRFEEMSRECDTYEGCGSCSAVCSWFRDY